MEKVKTFSFTATNSEKETMDIKIKNLGSLSLNHSYVKVTLVKCPCVATGKQRYERKLFDFVRTSKCDHL
jgi:hypothetical protein